MSFYRLRSVREHTIMPDVKITGENLRGQKWSDSIQIYLDAAKTKVVLFEEEQFATEAKIH